MPQRPIAVIGISCRFPGADGPAAFWQNIVQERASVGALPAGRWNDGLLEREAQRNGFTYCKSAGSVAEADCYDAGFFGITDSEAQQIDPQQGMVLEAAWHACEDAGVVPSSLAGTNAGVFVGVSTRDFDRRAAHTWPRLNIEAASGTCGAVVAGRLSYVLGLNGPSMAVDTACASSLTAIHMACRSLHDGESSVAFAGGVQLLLAPTNLVAFSRDGALSQSGACRPFSQDADGYVFGEGVGMLLLKPLEDALRDGDPVRAVIRGSAVNHNGRSNGLSAPSSSALQQVMQLALARAQMQASEIGYVEAHAIGTRIGDALEAQSIAKVYGASRPAGNICRLGSLKGNIGHLEAASGVASLIKAILAIENAAYPSSLQAEPESPLLRLDPQTMQISTALQPWEEGSGTRCAAVSASGFGGANAHVIVGQAPVRAQLASKDTSAPWLLAVSARSEAAFAQLCRRYCKWLLAERERGAPIETLRDFCRASLTTRAHLPLRRALLVSGWDDALSQLSTAQPSAPAKARCRVGIPTRQWQKQYSSSRERETSRLTDLLRCLGLRRLYADQDSPDFAALTHYAEQVGLGLVPYREKSAAFSDCLILADGESGRTDFDFIFQCGDDDSRYTAFVALLYESGFSLASRGMEQLLGASRHSLPLYPFERRRNHVLDDPLAPQQDFATDHLHIGMEIHYATL